MLAFVLDQSKTMDSKNDYLPERKGIIVVGMISSGKSTFLNSLLGITYLEANDNITTKLVTIIRYNEELKEPKFYHLKVISKSTEKSENEKNLKENPTVESNKELENNNNNKINEIKENIDNNYYFIKDGEEYIGANEIIKKISDINKTEASAEEPKYENLFYMLETNITNIKNKEFLKTHDFYDIPGLNEYILSDKKKEEKKGNDKNNNDNNKRNQNIEQSNEDMRYIKGIFQYIKNKIEREIFVLNAETYYKPQNLQIITEIKKYLNINFTDNLIILNKIDISNDRQKTIADCKQFFINNIDSQVFNINYNVFAPLNSIQFKNELLMRDNYEYYYLYYLNKYKEKYVNIKEEEENKIKIISFVEFIANEITSHIIKKEKKAEYLKTLANDVDNDKLKIIKKVYEDIKSKSNTIINYGINFDEPNEDEDDDDDDEDNSIIYIKAFYKTFEDKTNIPNYSEDVQRILDYFNNFKDKVENLETPPLAGNTEESPDKKAIHILKDIFKKLQKYVRKGDEGNIITDLNTNLSMMEKFILNHRKIYIPFIGVSSAGKSTIINCIVGYKLFPEALNECTTRGIIIEYSDVVELYETEIDSTRNYYVFSEKNRVAEGYKDVRDYLESLNYRYGNSESKYFYIVKTTIKSFDDFKFEDELKRRILLIDLPGSDTKDNKFNEAAENERSVYEKLLSISSSFIYINKGRAIKSQENQIILKNLYTKIQDSSKLGSEDYLKASFFVINMFSQLTENEMDINAIKEDLSTILFDKPDKSKDINSSIFNAKNFYDYLKNSVLLQDHEALINEFFKDFCKEDGISLSSSGNFPKFCLRKLKNKIKDFDLKVVSSEKCTPEFTENIMSFMKDKLKFLNESIGSNDKKTITQLANIFYYLENEINLEDMNVYKNSHCEGFLQILKKQIEFSKEYKDEDYKIKLKSILNYFDTFFSKNIKKDENESNTKKDFKEKREDLKKRLQNIFKDFTVKNLFPKIKEDIRSKFKDDNTKDYIKKDKKPEEIMENVKKDMNILLDDFTKRLNSNVDELNKNIQKLLEEIKNMTMFYNQGDIKNNEEFQNNFERLFNSGKDLKILESKKDGFISSFLNTIQGILNFFSGLFKKKEQKIKEDIINLRTKILNDLQQKQRNFYLKFKDERIKISGNFNLILGLAFTDLSNIEEKEWIESRKLYYEAKGFLLPDEKKEENEENEEKEEKKDNEEKEEKKENKEKEEKKDNKEKEEKK